MNLHVDAMRALGADIEYRNGYYFARAPGPVARRRGHLPRSDRDGHGERHPRGHAGGWPHGRSAPRPRSPRWTTSSRSSRCMGAEVERTAPDVIEVEGRRRLRGAEHRVMPDRIEAGTFVVAGAITGGAGDGHGRADAGAGRLPRRAGPDGRRRVRATARRSASGARHQARAPTRRWTSRPRPTRASPRTSSRPPPCCSPRPRGAAPSTRRSSRTAWSGWTSCARWARSWRSPTPTTPRSRALRRLHGAEVWMSDLRAGASLILGALRADGDEPHPRRTPGSAGV